MAYRVVHQGGEGEIIEKKSRFIATVHPSLYEGIYEAAKSLEDKE